MKIIEARENTNGMKGSKINALHRQKAEQSPTNQEERICRKKRYPLSRDEKGWLSLMKGGLEDLLGKR